MIRQTTIIFTAILLTCAYFRDVQAAFLEDLNYGFATYLGSGIYSASGKNVQVYQIPFSYQFFQPGEQKNWGLKLTIPVTLGFYDFKLEDLPDLGLPTDISTLSIVPGLQFQYFVTKKWQVRPFFDFGFAQNMTNGDASRIYSYGIRSYYEYPLEDVTFTLGNRLLHARQRGVERSASSDFGTFETSLDFRFKQFPFLKKHLADFSVYYANFQYYDVLRIIFPDDREVTVVKQNEVGITFGVQIQKKTRFIDIPRIGLAVRRGDGLDIYRLVFGMPF
ncbi:hypothetical protein [Kaarinaea lacus]